MSPRTGGFATWATVAIYLGIPAVFCCGGLVVLVSVYGFR